MLSHAVLFVPPESSAYNGQRPEGAKEFAPAHRLVKLRT